MNVWFMFDNHTFAKVGDPTTPRAAMEQKARDLFAEDGCGSLFTRNAMDRSILPPLHGTRQDNGRYGVTDDALRAFFDKLDDCVNWEARG